MERIEARWSTLEDYAREEISAYEAEAAYVHAALSSLQGKCQLQVEMNSYVLFNREVTYDQNKQVLEYYESWHHPDRTRLTIDLHRTC